MGKKIEFIKSKCFPERHGTNQYDIFSFRFYNLYPNITISDVGEVNSCVEKMVDGFDTNVKGTTVLDDHVNIWEFKKSYELVGETIPLEVGLELYPIFDLTGSDIRSTKSCVKLMSAEPIILSGFELARAFAQLKEIAEDLEKTIKECYGRAIEDKDFPGQSFKILVTTASIYNNGLDGDRSLGTQTVIKDVYRFHHLLPHVKESIKDQKKEEAANAFRYTDKPEEVRWCGYHYDNKPTTYIFSPDPQSKDSDITQRVQFLDDELRIVNIISPPRFVGRLKYVRDYLNNPLHKTVLRM